MKTLTRIAAVLILGAPSLAAGQTGAPPAAKDGAVRIWDMKKSELETALEEALKLNPDLRVASAAVMKAEADLVKAKLDVARKVVTTYEAIILGRAEVEKGTAALKGLQESIKSGAPTTNNAEQDVLKLLATAKAKLATAEADLAYLRGKAAAKTLGVTVLDRHEVDIRLFHLGRAEALGLRMREQAALGTAGPEPLRKLLDKRFTVRVENKPTREVLEVLREAAPGVTIHAPGLGKSPGWDVAVSMSLKDASLGAALQLFEDVTEKRFVVRAYGLLVVAKGDVPPGAVLLSDYWRPYATAADKKDGR